MISRLAAGCLFAMMGITALLAFAAPAPQPDGRVRETFDSDPKWEGHRNRLVPNPRPVTVQDFGYSRTNHAGGKVGEIGGRSQRSVTPAYYARKIPTRTLNDPLRASGKFSVTSADGASGVNFGWFNDQSRGWRTPNSLVLRFDGNGGKYWAFFEYDTKHWLAGGKGAFEGERYQTTKTKPFAADGTVHQWALQYDPSGNHGSGTLSLTIDDQPYTLDVPPERRADGAEFNRFGMLNLMTQGNAMEAWFDDVTVGGETFDFSEDPGWEGKGNHVKFEERVVRPFHDFGFSDTRYAGGDKGEIGGVMWRDEAPAFYAAKTETLTLNNELFASGKLAFTGAGSDSGICLGWFDAKSKLGQVRPQNEVPPTNMMSLMIEGPSRIGHYFRPAYWNSRGAGRIVDKGPIIRPDGKPHTWSMHYDPAGAGGNGRITWKLDDVEQTEDLKPGIKAAGATFDHFGFLDVQSGGHYVFLYADDLTFTRSAAR
jgi:hypothetical protein